MTTLEAVKPWPCEALCDAPGCTAMVRFALRFSVSETPGLSTLYLCLEHTAETEANYEKAGGATR